MIFYGTLFMQTGGSGGGGGINAAGTTAYNGANVSLPTASKFANALLTQIVGGAAGNTGNAGNGVVVQFTAGGLSSTSPAVRPLVGTADRSGGGGASIFGGGTGGGNGGSIGAAGVVGSRGSGGGGGGASSILQSGAGGRGSDGFVFFTIW
jgi:hypothetical protein